MKNNITVKVDGFGKMHLEDHGGFYYVTDNEGNFLGEIYPDEVEDWCEDDHKILAEILSDLLDDGTLEQPYMEEDMDYGYEE